VAGSVVGPVAAAAFVGWRPLDRASCDVGARAPHGRSLVRRAPKEWIGAAPMGWRSLLVSG